MKNSEGLSNYANMNVNDFDGTKDYDNDIDGTVDTESADDEEYIDTNDQDLKTYDVDIEDDNSRYEVIDNEDMNKTSFENEEKKPSKYKVTQVMLLLRTIIGGYLLYTVYQLVGYYVDGTGLSLPLLLVCSTIFGITGLLLVGFSLKSFIMGEYIGGKADKDGDE